MRAWIKANPERKKFHSRNTYFRRNYGIDAEEKDRRIKRQNEVCANPGCKRTDPGGNGRWQTDHNHITNQLRGELCHGCNTSLGQLEEDKARIQGLVDYLAGWDAVSSK